MLAPISTRGNNNRGWGNNLHPLKQNGNVSMSVYAIHALLSALLPYLPGVAVVETVADFVKVAAIAGCAGAIVDVVIAGAATLSMLVVPPPVSPMLMALMWFGCYRALR